MFSLQELPRFGAAAATVRYAPTELDDDARAAIAIRCVDDGAAMLQQARLTLGLAANYGDECAELDDLQAAAEKFRAQLDRTAKLRRRRAS